jgi:GNAT superfamily N-acetyltransferase
MSEVPMTSTTDASSRTAIRHAHDADAPAIAALLTQLGYPIDAAHVPPRIARFTAAGAGALLVAEVDGAVAAIAALEITNPIHHADPVAHLSAFVVGADYRRRGLGRRLLAEVEHVARATGCRRIVVTSAEHRGDAHGFYLGAGWKFTGRRFARELTA